MTIALKVAQNYVITARPKLHCSFSNSRFYIVRYLSLGTIDRLWEWGFDKSFGCKSFQDFFLLHHKRFLELDFFLIFQPLFISYTSNHKVLHYYSKKFSFSHKIKEKYIFLNNRVSNFFCLFKRVLEEQKSNNLQSSWTIHGTKFVFDKKWSKLK